jgi:hypothetical protein
MTPIVNLDAEYPRVTEHWSPRVVAIANGHIMQPHRRIAVAVADLKQSNTEQLFAGNLQII